MTRSMGLISYILGRGETEGHRDALARVLRTIGAYAFDLPDASARDFADEAEAVARQLESEPLETPATATGPDVVARFVERRRRAEVEYVRATIPGLRSALFEVVREVSSGLGESESEDAEVGRAMDALAEALATGSQEEIRAHATSALGVVKENLRRRERRARSQIERMGQQLKEMQARVVEAEAKQSEDKLTGIPNRAALDEKLEEEVMVAQLTGDPMSVLMLDVDHFKRFNDTHGHAAGDRVLAAVGDVLVQCFPRKADFAARYGGEEFCVVLPDVALEKAARLAERFRVAIRDLVLVHDGQELRVTCSVGAAQLAPRENPAGVLGRADAALYEAKRGGRDRVARAALPTEG
jgi:diguanylate cyclase